MGDMFRPHLGHHRSYINLLHYNLCKICILKLGPDDDLGEVETCRPCKNSTTKINKMCLTDVILVFRL